MYIDYFRKDKSDFYSNVNSKTTIEEFAMMMAAADGFAQVLKC